MGLPLTSFTMRWQQPLVICFLWHTKATQALTMAFSSVAHIPFVKHGIDTTAFVPTQTNSLPVLGTTYLHVSLVEERQLHKTGAATPFHLLLTSSKKGRTVPASSPVILSLPCAHCALIAEMEAHRDAPLPVDDASLGPQDLPLSVLFAACWKDANSHDSEDDENDAAGEDLARVRTPEQPAQSTAGSALAAVSL